MENEKKRRRGKSSLDQLQYKNYCGHCIHWNRDDIYDFGHCSITGQARHLRTFKCKDNYELSPIPNSRKYRQNGKANTVNP